MKKRNITIVFLFSLLALTAHAQKDKVIRNAFDSLDGAYASDVKPHDAVYTQCTYAQIEKRHVARCGISYGGNQLTHIGYWEIERQGDSYLIYAMNGKALSALDKINHPGSLSSVAEPGVFKNGQGRTPFDIQQISRIFE